MWGLCELAWCTWCGLGEAKDSAPHRHSNGVSWGCAKSVVNLAISPHASANPTIPQQIVCLHEGLLLQVTQGGAEHMDELTQKGNSTGGCNVVARAQRAEERPWGGARESQSTEKVEGVTGNGKCWSGKNVKKAGDRVLARIYCNDQFPWCRQDISLVSNVPIGTGFGPQNITIITSQESHHQHAFLIRIPETLFHMRSKLKRNYAIKCVYFLLFQRRHLFPTPSIIVLVVIH